MTAGRWTVEPVRNDRDHRRALARMEAILDGPPDASRDELEVLQAVVDRYERDRFELPQTTALEAIRFRMEQASMRPRDLVPLLGSRARVSEVLQGRRQLSIDMIRALHVHLGIPAGALIAASPEQREVAPSPAAMAKLVTLGVMRAGETVGRMIARAFGPTSDPALLRRTRTERVNAKTDGDALVAWSAAAVIKSTSQRRHRLADFERPTAASARRLAELSLTAGPAAVPGHLAAEGIAFVTLDHLPGTYLDGASMLRVDGRPLIALTLRHDRIDNFWFTLLHEYAHVWRHLGEGRRVILDDLQLAQATGIEDEADTLAQKALIPPAVARRLSDSDLSLDDLHDIARRARVHPAIVAGRWQRDHKDYRRFARLLGHGEVRGLFG